MSVVREDGTEELRYPAANVGSGHKTETMDGFRFFTDSKSAQNYQVHAADIIDDTLYYADNLSGIKTVKLSG
jgi:hypothetical protein